MTPGTGSRSHPRTGEWRNPQSGSLFRPAWRCFSGLCCNPHRPVSCAAGRRAVGLACRSVPTARARKGMHVQDGRPSFYRGTVWYCMVRPQPQDATVVNHVLRLKEPRFLQIRLGRESCDQISASPNKPKRAKSRDKTAGSLFTRAYTLVKFSQTKRCFFSFL